MYNISIGTLRKYDVVTSFVFILLMICVKNSSQAQSKPIFDISLGLTTKMDFYATDIGRWNRFLNYGISSQLGVGNNVEINFNTLVSQRKYRTSGYSTYLLSSDGSPTLASTDPITTADEILLELEYNLTYKFNNKPISPFVGLGFAFQQPIKTSGTVTYKIEDPRNLEIPSDISPASKFGIHILSGINIKIGAKMKLNASIEYKYFSNSNTDVYQYDIYRNQKSLFGYIRERRDEDHSFLIGTGIMYQLNNRKTKI